MYTLRGYVHFLYHDALFIYLNLEVRMAVFLVISAEMRDKPMRKPWQDKACKCLFYLSPGHCFSRGLNTSMFYPLIFRE